MSLVFVAFLLVSSVQADHFNKYLAVAPVELKAVLADLQQSVVSKDASKTLESYPSKLLGEVAKRAKVTEAELRKQWTQSKLEGDQSFEFDVNHVYAMKLKSGRPIVMIPTINRLTIDGKKAVIQLYTLAFEEEGRWRIMMMHTESQYSTLADTYPDFNDDTIPRDSRHGYRTE